MRRIVRVGALAAASLAAGCSSAYYATMEQVGVHKRDIMVERVEKARDAQREAKREFADALARFRSVVDVRGGELEAKYGELKDALERGEDRAEEVHERIRAVEDVSGALFDEWKKELGQYHDQGLRRASQQKLDATRGKYEKLIAAMKRAEARIEPVLVPLRDQVLFLKHNLNARAIASLDDELAAMSTGVDKLLKEMETAIAEADRFIVALKEK